MSEDVIDAPWGGDDQLLEEGKRAARQAKGCVSVLLADAEIGGESTRAYFVCSGGTEKHTVHTALNGDTWWRESVTGYWRHDGDALTNINTKGASTE